MGGPELYPDLVFDTHSFNAFEHEHRINMQSASREGLRGAILLSVPWLLTPFARRKGNRPAFTFRSKAWKTLPKRRLLAPQICKLVRTVSWPPGFRSLWGKNPIPGPGGRRVLSQTQNNCPNHLSATETEQNSWLHPHISYVISLQTRSSLMLAT